MTFDASANDVEDGDLTASLIWSSNRDGAISSGGNFIRNDLSPGLHIIYVSVTDAGALTTTESFSITIDSVPTISITLPGDGDSFVTGTIINFAGTAYDLQDGSLSNSIAWSSDIDPWTATGASVSTRMRSTGADAKISRNSVLFLNVAMPDMDR